LKEEGIYDRNKSLKIPLLPQRIAIISVETSKGYKDFLGKIDNNPEGYCFFHVLFPSLLQGEKIVQSISAQLQQIRKVMHHFDAVVIVRGGGGDIGLSSYNNYLLAKEIALFPLPVLTGIGHITNETVVEKVACRNFTTPSELAGFLIMQFHDFSVTLGNAKQKIVGQTNRIISSERYKFQTEMKLFRTVGKSALFYIRNQLLLLREKLSDKSLLLLKEQTVWLENTQKYVHSSDPKEVMRRGYSITFHNGKAVKSISQLNAGDALHTLVFDGEIISTIQTTHKEKSYE
ncbi:MAG: exodeoxyribonuclease VII large subunit, partial [Tannerella sp.]|nr:exodeoxyribonuclease VII large subunit [Tannerella sp.]